MYGCISGMQQGIRVALDRERQSGCTWKMRLESELGPRSANSMDFNMSGRDGKTICLIA